MKRKAILLFTDQTCDINGRIQTDLPLLLDRERKVVHAVSDWFRYQAVVLNYPSSTLRSYAEIMRSFWNYLSDNNINWREVDDAALIRWRNHQEIDIGNKKGTINQRLSTVFGFYCWAQTRGYVNDIVADPNALNQSVPPKISTAVKPIGSRSGIHPKFTMRSPLLYKTTRQPSVHTPTADEATRLHATLATASGPSVAERNTLMLSWAEEAGLRRKEFAALTIDQIPGWTEIDSLIENDSYKDVELIVTKGGRPRIVQVVPDLLLRTRNYIEDERAKCVQRFMRKYGAAYQPCASIFVSEKTGGALTLRSITNLFRSAFKKSKVEGSGHRMRARYLTNLVQYYYEEALSKEGRWISLDIVLLKAAEAAGHLHPESLRPYLNLIRKRSLTSKQTGRGRYLEQRLLSVERHLSSKASRLETTLFLATLNEAIRSGNRPSVRRAWMKVETSIADLL
jgi:site-specific recombinase XerD